MVQSYIPYFQIPATAISQVTEVIINDEGGWKFNDEAGGDWNYAGMLSANFIGANKALKECGTDKMDIKHDLSNYTSVQQLNELTIELYYNKFYLPLLNHIKEVHPEETFIEQYELSAAINCGLDTAKFWLDQDSSDSTYFLNLWEDHYIHLVVENAKAWQDYAIKLSHNFGKTFTAMEQGPEPHPLRAPNLQGWINRVRRYRDAS